MEEVFRLKDFRFPYDQVRFPGQASEERVLFITREAPVVMYLRLAVVVMTGVIVGVIGVVLPWYIPEVSAMVKLGMAFGGVVVGGGFWALGWWWIYRLWRNSIFILTTRRLTKFIYTTPWNRYNLSLGLDSVVDTGAYSRGYFQALLGVGTFTARSSAGNRRDKYFFIENVYRAEDLANYVNKVLFEFNREVSGLDTFRPFIPFLKAEERKKFMKNYPQFWS